MKLIVAFLTLGLTACASTQQAQFSASAHCIESMRISGEFAPIFARYPFETGTITLEQQSDPMYLAAEDRPLFSRYADNIRMCTNIALAEGPNAADRSAYIKLVSTRDQIIVALYQGKITYGQANSARILNAAQFSEASAQVRSQINQQQQAARDAAILQILSQPLPQPYQARPYVMPTPTITNCIRNGVQTTCTSQ